MRGEEAARAMLDSAVIGVPRDLAGLVNEETVVVKDGSPRPHLRLLVLFPRRERHVEGRVLRRLARREAHGALCAANPSEGTDLQ